MSEKSASERLADARKLGPMAALIFMSVESNRRALDREENTKLDAQDAANAANERDAVATLERAGATHSAHLAYLKATNQHVEAQVYAEAHAGDIRKEEYRFGFDKEPTITPVRSISEARRTANELEDDDPNELPGVA